MKKYLILTFLCFWMNFGENLKAQDVPFYIHFFNNFYLQNPAMAGSSGHPVMYFTHHQQLIGTAQDAPQHTSLSFNSPFKNSRSSIGFNVYNFKRSILKTNGAYVSFAHRVDFGINHNIQIGISGGFSSNGINSTDLLAEDINTLITANRYNNKILPDGQFGVVYQIGYLQLGATMPKLFSAAANYKNNEVRELYPFRNRLFTASYQYYASPDWMIQPFVIYRDFEYDMKGVEINGTVTYRDQFWVGASYRQNYGSGFMLGMKAKERLSVGFAYKFANNQQYNYSNTAYELQIGVHFEKKQTQNPIQAAITVNPINHLPKANPVKVPVDTSMTKILKMIKIVQQGHSKNKLEMDVNHYVVVGSFRVQQNAQAYVYRLRRDNFNSNLGFNSTNGTYYVYVLSSEEREEAVEEIKRLRLLPGFESTWMLKIISSE